MQRQEALLKASAAFEHRAASSSSLPSFPNSSSLSVGATTGVSGDVRGDGGRGGGGGAESSDVDTETTATSQSSSLALQRGRRLSAAASAFKEAGAAANTVTTTTSATAASSTLNPMTARVGGERERERGEERGGRGRFFSKVDDSERTGNDLKRSDGPLSHRLAAAAPDLIPEDAIGALRFQLQLTNGSSSQRPNGSGNNKPNNNNNNKNDDASSALSSLFSGSGGGGGGVGGLGGLAVEFLRVGGPADTPYGSEAVCRRCNGEEVLGSGLFLRCEACFDW